MDYKLDELRDKIKEMAEVAHLAWSTNKEAHIQEAAGGPLLIPHRVYMAIDDVSISSLDFIISTNKDGFSHILVRDQQSSIVAGILRKSLGLDTGEKPQIAVPKLVT